jgi:hypothetical protein
VYLYKISDAVLYHNAPGKRLGPDAGGLVAAVYETALDVVSMYGLDGFLDHEFVALVYVY